MMIYGMGAQRVVNGIGGVCYAGDATIRANNVAQSSRREVTIVDQTGL